ncbi:SPOR domain-containing protein [Roseovarius sp. D22-M7]|uniref:SPOR domain-containing protein n=1 Tax=Roseovarius sp. D22-M7 TaxID=3127116 RepID=UPI00300FBED7
MAEMQEARPGAVHGGVATLTTFTNITGAVLSLALIAGIGIWGYKLVIRDVSGVPVVRAIEGPMREQPADPGGRSAAHQGLTVNAIAEKGAAANPADRLILAPPPLELTLADIPRSGAAGEAANQVQDASVSLEAETPGAEDGIGRSLRPRLRPDIPEAVAFAVASVRNRNRSAPEVEVAPETISKGTRLAQLGVFDSAEVAREEWQRMASRFEGFLEGKQRVVQRTESGGRTFYRLRAMGFADLGEARRFCSALAAENAECIPVLTR